jgi:hypothetical protein
MTWKHQLLRILLLAALMYGGAVVGLAVFGPTIWSGGQLELFYAETRSIVYGAIVGLLLFIIFDVYPGPTKRDALRLIVRMIVWAIIVQVALGPALFHGMRTESRPEWPMFCTIVGASLGAVVHFGLRKGR